MLRLFKIALSRFSEASLADSMALVIQSLFRSEWILVYRLDLDQFSTAGSISIQDMEILKGNISDLDHAQKQINPVPWEFCCHKFDGVKDFFIARNNEGIQHISWIYYQNDPNRLTVLGERDAEIKYCLTLPAYRGKGIYPFVLKSIAQFLAQQGYERIFMCVAKDNYPSIRGIEKAGFKKAGEVHLQKILGIQVSKKFDTGDIKNAVSSGDR